MDWQEAAALAAVVAALIAGAGVWDQYRRGRRSEGLDFVWRIRQEWNSIENRARRQKVAEDLLKEPKEVSRLTVDILNFFETVGFYVRVGSISVEAAWMNFSPFAVGYWFACRPQILRKQRQDRTQFADLEYLVDRFLTFEQKKRRVSRASVKLSKQEVARFLRNESRVPSDTG